MIGSPPPINQQGRRIKQNIQSYYQGVTGGPTFIYRGTHTVYTNEFYIKGREGTPPLTIYIQYIV